MANKQKCRVAYEDPHDSELSEIHQLSPPFNPDIRTSFTITKYLLGNYVDVSSSGNEIVTEYFGIDMVWAREN